MTTAHVSTDPSWVSRFEQLVREHENALITFALRLSGSRSDASDLVQDTLERALRSFDSFTPGTNGRAWLFTILRHTFIYRCRRRRRDDGDCIDDLQVPAPEPEGPSAWDAVSPEQLALAIDSLADDFARVYRMHAIDALSYQEIAARLGIPMNTVGTRLVRARQKLRTMLEASAHACAQAF